MSQTVNNGSTNAPRIYRDTNLINTPVSAYTGSCEFTGYTFRNTNSSDAFVKFCNESSGSTTAGTTTVVRVVDVPANTTVFHKEPKGSSLQYFNTGLTLYAVTGSADSSTTTPSTGLYCEIYYNIS